MYTSKNNPSILLLTCCFSLLFCLQNNSGIAQDTLTADGLFQMARKAAFDENDYAKAKMYCNKVLETSPGYTDVTVFLGRLYSWSKQYDSARIVFQKALEQKADYADASVAYADMEYWAGNNNAALDILDTALSYHPQSSNLLLRKAKVYNALHNYKEANKIVDSLLKENNSNADARALSARIKDNA